MFAKKINDKNFLNKLVEDQGYSVIDTRDPVEYRDGTLYDAPNAPLRNFMGEYMKTLKNNSKVILIGSDKDEAAFKACIRYAEQHMASSPKNVKLSYYYL